MYYVLYVLFSFTASERLMLQHYPNVIERCHSDERRSGLCQSGEHFPQLFGWHGRLGVFSHLKYHAV